jgi:hypothetical protein
MRWGSIGTDGFDYVEAADVLRISERHFLRLRDKYEADGAEGLSCWRAGSRGDRSHSGLSRLDGIALSAAHGRRFAIAGCLGNSSAHSFITASPSRRLPVPSPKLRLTA